MNRKEIIEKGCQWIDAEEIDGIPNVLKKLIRNGQKEKLGADGEVQIYDFTLKIKFTE